VPLDRHDLSHPDVQTMDQFLDGTLHESAKRQVIAHLATFCDPCWSYLRGAHGRVRSLGRHLPRAGGAGTAAGGAGGADGGGTPAVYDAAFASSLELSAAGLATIRAAELEATSLWAILEGTPPAQRTQLVQGDPRFHNHRIVHRLLATAGEYHWRDTGRGLEACRLALAIVDELLPVGAYPAGLANDLHARALGALADTLRLDGQLEAAGATLERAWEALEEGTGDPLEHAALLRVAANLRFSLGDLDGTADLLRPAAAIYRLCRDGHLEGRTLQKLALAVGYADSPKGAALAKRALALIDPSREPQLELAARHAYIWFLNDSGHSWQALDLLERSRPLYRQLGDSQPRLLLPWLEARICRQLGQLTAAERGLVAVWHQFRQAGFHQELTLVSLDLAETYIAQGKSRHAIRLLKTFHSILRHWRMHTEGIAAWLLLMEAAAGQAERAQALTREMALYFRRAWRRSLPFPAAAPPFRIEP
jgi:tetratricopeptide (TPR) repeat protein